MSELETYFEHIRTKHPKTSNVKTFDMQILEYIRFQDDLIELLRMELNDLERKIEMLKEDVHRLRLK